MAQTCESCRSIDVREWARQGYLRPGQRFSWPWSHGGEPCGSITVRTGPDAVPGAVVLSFRSRGSSWNEWKSIEDAPLFDLSATARIAARAKLARLEAWSNTQNSASASYFGGGGIADE